MIPLLFQHYRRHLLRPDAPVSLARHRRLVLHQRSLAGDPDFEAPFYILRHTYCAAVLTENGFMDNKLSLAFLESEEGEKAIVALHVEGIIAYIQEYEARPVK